MPKDSPSVVTENQLSAKETVRSEAHALLETADIQESSSTDEGGPSRVTSLPGGRRRHREEAEEGGLGQNDPQGPTSKTHPDMGPTISGSDRRQSRPLGITDNSGAMAGEQWDPHGLWHRGRRVAKGERKRNSQAEPTGRPLSG